MKSLSSFLLTVLAIMLLGQPAGAQLKFDTVPGGFFRIKSVQSGETGVSGFWDQPGNKNMFSQGDSIAVGNKAPTNDQFYRFAPAGGGWYTIVSANKGNVDVAGGRNGDGVDVRVWGANGGDSQKFRLVHRGEGRYRIYTAWGRAVCLAGRSHAAGSNVHTWGDHDGAWMEWYLFDPFDKKHVPPPASISGSVKAFLVDPKTGERRERPAAGTIVDVWTYTPGEAKTAYRKAESIPVDAAGAFVLPEIYSGQSTLMLLAHHPERETARVVLSPSRGARSADIVMERFDSADYALVETKHRGKKYYYLDNGIFYLKYGTITRRDDFFFPGLARRTPAVYALIKALGGGGPVANEAELVARINGVWSFLAKYTKSSMGASEPVVREASEYLFRNAYANPNQTTGMKAVKNWPSIEDYADTYAKYGFIPLANCTSWALATAALFSAAGIGHDSFFVAKFNYDPSWIVEHWVLAVKLNNRWYSLDPQGWRVPLGDSPATFGRHPAFTRDEGPYDFKKPFEAVLLPGSRIDRVPYCGDPAELRALLGAGTAKVAPR